MTVRGPYGLVVKSADISFLTALSGLGSSPTQCICKTSQVLLAGVPGGFLWVLPFFLARLI